MADLSIEPAASIPSIVLPTIPSNYPAIAGFWRRLFAFLIDSVLLGIIGQIIGLIFSTPLYELGPYAKPIGLLFIIPYFGILNSKIGHGQTLGKRLLGIAVCDEENQPISLWRSLFRITILEMPVFLNGFPVNKIGFIDINLIVTIFNYGFSGAILYTMVFNRRARQGLHDLILSTYVVNLKAKPKDKFPKSARIHWIISGIWFFIVIIAIGVSSFIGPIRKSEIPYETMTSKIASISDDPRVFTVNMSDRTQYTNGEKKRLLIVNIWVKGKYDKEKTQESITTFAELIFSNNDEIDLYDGMTLNIINGYNLGIANVSISHNVSDSIENWRSLINQ